MKRWLLLGWLCCAACQFDPVIPSVATFRCATDGDCPEAQRCQLRLEVCVAAERFDEVAPSVTDATLKLSSLGDEPVTRLGAMGSAEISMVSSEPIAVPVLSSEPPLDCGLVRQSGPTSFVFLCVVRPTNGAYTGPAVVSAQLVDEAGNGATVVLSSLALTVDTEPPAAPDVETDGRIVYRRIPWGAEETQGAARFDVSGAALAAEPSVRVLARVGAETIGRDTVRGDGSFGPVSFPFDAQGLALVASDQAGNRSAAVPVHQIEWVATLGGKGVPGRLNPHEANGFIVHGPALARGDGQPLESAQLGRVDGVSATARAGYSWELADRDVEANASGLTAIAAMGYDLARAREVGFGLFNLVPGGFGVPDLAIVTNETRTYNRVAVRKAVTRDPESDGEPAPRTSSAMAYHEELRAPVLFGGLLYGPQVPAGDTWVWNGSSWRSVVPSRSPPPRQEHGMVYDALRGRIVLVGGRGAADAGALTDTWEFDGLDWEQVDAGAAPSSGVLAFHRGRGTVFMAEKNNGRLWEYDGRWSPRDAGNAPVGFRALAYDARRDRLVAVGTFGGPSVTLEWNGAAWVTFAAPVVEPNALYFDPAQGAVVSQATGTKDPAVWDGTGWTRLPQRNSANLRLAGTAMAYSPADDAIVRFGGLSNGPVGTTSVWRGQWAPYGGFGPGARASAALAWDPFSNRLVLSGDDYWSFSVDAGWRLLPGAGPRSADGGSVGRVSMQTTADGVVAAALFMSDTAPGADGLHLLGRDGGWALLGDQPGGARKARSAALPDGGLLLLTEQMVGPYTSGWKGWELAGPSYSGAAATQVAVPAPLGPQANTFALFFPDFSTATLHLDSSRDRVIALGLPPGDVVWQYAGGAWSQARIADPELDGQPALLTTDVSSAHHPGLRRSVVVDSTDGTSWLLRSADTRPSVVFRVDTAAAAFPRGSTWTRLEVHAVAGAQAEGSQGAMALLWQNGAWLAPSGASNGAGSTSPAALSFTEQDPVALRNLLTHQPDLAVSIVPKTDTGRTDAVVAVDYVEIAVRYRVP